MQKVLIIEDDLVQAQSLFDTIKSQYTNWNIDSADTYDKATDLLKKSIETMEYYTLFLLDIQLSEDSNNRDGFVIAEEIRKYHSYFKTPILFLTVISEESRFALSNYHCYNYISKPYMPHDILIQIEQMLLTGYLENTLEIVDTCRIRHRIFLNDIQFVESKSHTLYIHTTNATFSTRQYSLEQFVEVLGHPFMRCHKCYIINRKLVDNYDKLSSCVHIMKNMIPIGRKFAKEFKNLQEY